MKKYKVRVVDITEITVDLHAESQADAMDRLENDPTLFEGAPCSISFQFIEEE